MSHTTIMAVWPGEKADKLRTFQNSHGSAPVIWNALAMKYLGLGNFEYSLHAREVWPLYKRADMPRHQRAVLLMTYDNAIVMKEDYKQAAADIRAFLSDFPQNHEYANHWPEVAGLFESDPDCPAIGFHMTSVSENPFQGQWNEEIEDYDPPDWKWYWDAYAQAEITEKEIKS